MSEETGTELVTEMITLNANIEELIERFNTLISILEADEVEAHAKKKPPAEQEEDVEEEEEEKEAEPTAEETAPEDEEAPSSQRPRYQFFGPEEYDPTIPMPECYGRKYGTPECKKIWDTCKYKELCSHIPTCFVDGYGSDDCLSEIEVEEEIDGKKKTIKTTKQEACRHAERCANLHKEEFEEEDDPKTKKLKEFGTKIKDLQEE